RCLSLPARIDDRPLPEVKVVDLRAERNKQGLTPLISRDLREAMAETLSRGEQSILFLNRRGFHTYIFCPDCGHVFACPNCDIALTLHAARRVLQCHHCDFTLASPESCPQCRGGRIRSHGAGTERVEEEVGGLFPQARIARMDSDTVLKKGEAAQILRRLDKGEIDILIGTQMIAKGHDFPGITLVGVAAADATLNLPDFRAAERTFQLLTQVAGRGGRGERPGRVVIQTFNPNHYVIAMARQHDYQGFYNAEMPLREQLGYPPFTRLVALHCSSLKQEEGKSAVQRLGARARALAGTIAGGVVDVIGPAASPLTRIRGRYRWQILLRSRKSDHLHGLTEALLAGREKDGLEVQVDVDPVNFM
ncbi:MAG: primosomal protein N', partial [Syntrophaceae bacterium]|nr:primosomal protein N' [Syntrophaceae bacterium]